MGKAWQGIATAVLAAGEAAREIRLDDGPTVSESLSGTELERLLAEPPSRVRRLVPHFPAVYARLAAVGPVEAVVANPVVDHAVTGQLGGMRVTPRAGTAVVTTGIDLHLFFNALVHGFAVVDPAHATSLRFLDEHGERLHTVYATAETDMEAWYDLIAECAADEQRPLLEPPLANGTAAHPLDGCQRPRRQWPRGRLESVLRRPRAQAKALDEQALERLFQVLADRGLPVNVLAGNAGAVQGFRGTVRWLHSSDRVFRVVDQGRHVTVRPAALAGVALVWRGSGARAVRTVEARDAMGAAVLSAGAPDDLVGWEADAWSLILDSLEDEAVGDGA